MKKVGIITIYKSNKNYGGLLQAYALSLSIKEMGLSSEIINYSQNKFNYRLNRFLNLGVMRTLVFFNNRVRTYIECLKKPSLKQNLAVRSKCLEDFEYSISHSELVSDDEIEILAKKYDILVCGSDQIWNPGLWSPTMFLDIPGFIGRRFSYAASIGRNYLTNKEKEFIKEHVYKLDSISVRENSAVKLIQPLTHNEVKTVLDPTFLLTKNEWVNFSRKPKGIPDKYVFSFFLGKNKYAKKKIYDTFSGKIPIVTIPHLQTGYKNEDELYSDICLYDIGPKEWVWLILNAEMIFTDSFHGTAFSINLGKQFYCFAKCKNSDKQSINSRLMDLLSLCGLQNRMILDADGIASFYDYIDYSCIETVLNKKKIDSLNYLKSNLYYER